MGEYIKFLTLILHGFEMIKSKSIHLRCGSQFIIEVIHLYLINYIYKDI